jgi:hypothetical protein
MNVLTLRGPTMMNDLKLTLFSAAISASAGIAPAAHSAAAAALDIGQSLVSPEAINRNRARVVARPVALALAQTIDEQACYAMGADRSYGDGSFHCSAGRRCRYKTSG